MGRKDRRRFRQFLQPYHELSPNPFIKLSGIQQGCIEPGSEGLFHARTTNRLFLGDNEQINWTTSTTRPEHGKEVEENKFDYGITSKRKSGSKCRYRTFPAGRTLLHGIERLLQESERDFSKDQPHSFIGIQLSYR